MRNRTTLLAFLVITSHFLALYFLTYQSKTPPVVFKEQEIPLTTESQAIVHEIPSKISATSQAAATQIQDTKATNHAIKPKQKDFDKTLDTSNKPIEAPPKTPAPPTSAVNTPAPQCDSAKKITLYSTTASRSLSVTLQVKRNAQGGVIWAKLQGGTGDASLDDEVERYATKKLAFTNAVQECNNKVFSLKVSIKGRDD